MPVKYLAAITVAASSLSAANASEIDSARFVLSGYGEVKYETSELQDSSAYSARFVPIFLFSLSDKIHVEAETEISLNAEGETEVELEYADLHYFLTDTTTLTAGKFLVPFGQFGPNIHPSWINRSPWTPGIYGSHGSNQAMEALLPILSDVGVAVQQTIVLGGHQKIFIDLYSTNGPGVEADDHAEEPVEDEHQEEESDHAELPELAFEATSGDNNKDKAFGGRVAYAMLPGLELGASYYSASYDEEESLDFRAQGIDINLIGSHYLLRGEYIETQTDGREEEEGESEIHTFKRDGWYLQSTFQTGKLWPSLSGTELVLEYAETNKLAKASRWMVGVNYWLDARSVIKVAYDDTDLEEGEDDQRFAIQLSYGF
ncbi:porin [Marinagarivorans cellulosilyticus]|uniref:Porin n=1 Tax=Marinagarivorans cellulosilyticus TaxID=2721545 RepID=A0AAN2BL40_9GAMM|nr:porin [Marinagarivorans cellulosilyticus]BCD98689.1 hypothetical protein MARGE09_P2890 [Marinagarivorans cellulosilyticus]